jgi:hypothetical protein
MRLGRSALVLTICGLALAGCGGGGTTPAPAPTPIAAPLQASYVFAGDPSGTTTVEYGLKGDRPDRHAVGDRHTECVRLRRLGQAPTALAFDRSGNLYAYASDIGGAENESNIYKSAPGSATAVIDSRIRLGGRFLRTLRPHVDDNDELIPGGVIQDDAVGPAAPARTFNYAVALAVDPVKNLYVLEADSVTGSAPSSTYHIGQFAYNTSTPARTFESSGTAIGLSGVP